MCVIFNSLLSPGVCPVRLRFGRRVSCAHILVPRLSSADLRRATYAFSIIFLIAEPYASIVDRSYDKYLVRKHSFHI